MCSDESKEWHEKEEKGKRHGVNGKGLNYVGLESQGDKGGSEGRINARTVSGIFGMCTSTDI